MLPFNVPCHMEFITKDFKVWESFYGQIFGWKLKHDGKIYNHIDYGAESPITGGVLQLNQDSVQGVQYPFVYIKVASIDETLKKSIELGATITKNIMLVEGKGKSAAFTDKEGNTVSLWEDK